MKRLSLPLFAALVPLAMSQLGQSGCEPEPDDSCDLMVLEVDMDWDFPVVHVTNLNPTTAKYQMVVQGNYCDTQDCPISLAINDVTIDSGQTQSLIVEPGVQCADVVCCEEGWTGSVSAELLLFGDGCTISARGSRDECLP